MKRHPTRQTGPADTDVGAHLLRLLDHLPDVWFYLKDRKGRFTALNRRGCEVCGVRSEREALGRTDADFFPEVRAREFQADDRAVMRSGRPILNRVHPAPDSAGSPRLVVSTRIPLRNRRGEVVGGGRVFPRGGHGAHEPAHPAAPE